MREISGLRNARRLIHFTKAKAKTLKSLLARHSLQKVLIFTADTETAYAISREFLVMPLTADIKRKERIFPDFWIQHRRDPSRKWFLEIIGFWTPEYLSRKLENLERAGILNLILCVDEKLGCSGNTFLRRNCTIFYQKKIDPALVLAALRE